MNFVGTFVRLPPWTSLILTGRFTSRCQWQNRQKTLAPTASDSNISQWYAPFMYFVSECMHMSAPQSSGLCVKHNENLLTNPTIEHDITIAIHFQVKINATTKFFFKFFSQSFWSMHSPTIVMTYSASQTSFLMRSSKALKGFDK